MPQEKAAEYAARLEKVINELIETERDYVSSLQTTMLVFMNPLLQRIEQNRPVVSLADVRRLFGQLPVICNINRVFLSDLNEWRCSREEGGGGHGTAAASPEDPSSPAAMDVRRLTAVSAAQRTRPAATQTSMGRILLYFGDWFKVYATYVEVRPSCGPAGW